MSEKAIGRQDISAQGSPGELAEQYGTPFPDPNSLQHSTDPPKKEPFMMDDFGWVLGFSLGIPIFIFAAIGIFLLGDFRSPKDNLFYGGIGVIVGAIIGSILAGFLKLYRNMIIKQERKAVLFYGLIRLRKSN
ncbi:AtpZ/AtpI family protein [Legionella tunisiensis]|uniref:AtpZ/AtpI family protein n=1 Tax=Legionella tunisiensis TaxID=1034944 RepID=UPI0002E49975|nr:AtpZ/AtpI family protein [Legionella tunisiensis]